MAKLCKECSKQLPLFSSSTICKDCDKLQSEKLLEIKNDVSNNLELNEEQADFLRAKFDKGTLLDFYNDIYSKLLAAKGITQSEIESLLKIKDGLKLSAEDISFDERIKPYIYVNFIMSS